MCDMSSRVDAINDNKSSAFQMIFRYFARLIFSTLPFSPNLKASLVVLVHSIINFVILLLDTYLFR